MTTENDGSLRMLPSGRWAVCCPGRAPVEIASGEMFLVQVPRRRELQGTRMQYRHLPGGGGEYYSQKGYRLREGLRAGFYDQRERHAKVLIT